MKKIRTENMIARTENMLSCRGNKVLNQFLVHTKTGTYYQSYSSLIAYRNSETGEITLDRYKWDYSRTTGIYRNIFLGETKKETEAKIKSGEYKLENLNPDLTRFFDKRR